MKIRKATLKDIPSIVKINRESEDSLDNILGIDDKFIRNESKDLIKNKKGEYFIFEDKAFLCFKSDFVGFSNCELYYLMVSKKFQRQGIGTKMVKFIENYAKKKNFKSIYLYTHPIHKNAIKLYKKLKYKKINEFPNYYSNGDRSLLFGKKLK